jgi:hypothetical protein
LAKSKCQNKDVFFVGGYRMSTQNPKVLGALMLGRKKGKKLEYAGQVGFGFTAKMQDDLLILEPEPENAFDENAVKVLRRNGRQLGYLSEEIAEEMAERSEAGWSYFALVSEVTGGGDKMHGCNIRLVVCEPEASPAEVKDYLETVSLELGGGGQSRQEVPEYLREKRAQEEDEAASFKLGLLVIGFMALMVVAGAWLIFFG